MSASPMISLKTLHKHKHKKKQFPFPLLVGCTFLVVFFFFLVVNRECGLTPSGDDKKGIRRLAPDIQLKLSADDLILLNRPGYLQWINVDLIESYNKEYRVKIMRLEKSAADFQLNIDGHVFYLFKMNKKRKELYAIFKKAVAAELERSTPVQVQLKINGVFLGNYLLEEKIYEQVRDERGSYFIRWNTDTLRLRKIRYEVANGYTGTLSADFDTPRLAAVFIFFSRLEAGNPFDFGRLVFRFHPRDRKYRPYLTVESLIYGLEYTN